LGSSAGAAPGGGRPGGGGVASAAPALEPRRQPAELPRRRPPFVGRARGIRGGGGPAAVGCSSTGGGGFWVRRGCDPLFPRVVASPAWWRLCADRGRRCRRAGCPLALSLRIVYTALAPWRPIPARVRHCQRVTGTAAITYHPFRMSVCFRVAQWQRAPLQPVPRHAVPRPSRVGGSGGATALQQLPFVAFCGGRPLAARDLWGTFCGCPHGQGVGGAATVEPIEFLFIAVVAQAFLPLQRANIACLVFCPFLFVCGAGCSRLCFLLLFP